MKALLQARYLTKSEHASWNELVAGSPQGSIYQTTNYLDVLTEESGAQYNVLVVERGGQIVGGLPIFERTGFWGKYVSGRLLLYYNGFVLKAQSSKYPSERTASNLAVLAALEGSIRQLGYNRVQVKGRAGVDDVRVFLDRGWKATPSYTYVVPLSDLSTTWSRIEQNLRRLILRCTRDGMQFVLDGDFDSFYQLHLQTHHRKAAPVYLPEQSFRRYFQRLHAQQLCRIFHASLPDGRVAASQLVLLGRHPVSHTVCAATAAEHLPTGVSPFLRWKVFEELAHMGYTGNDLTDAQLNPVTHFKSQLGGDLQMNLILDQPDRGRFLLQPAVSKVGGWVKAALRKVKDTLPSSPGRASAPPRSVA